MALECSTEAEPVRVRYVGPAGERVQFRPLTRSPSIPRICGDHNANVGAERSNTASDPWPDKPDHRRTHLRGRVDEALMHGNMKSVLGVLLIEARCSRVTA